MTEAATQEGWPRTVEAFETWHARQPERWEFICGWPRMMAPASMTYSVIKPQRLSGAGQDFRR